MVQIFDSRQTFPYSHRPPLRDFLRFLSGGRGVVLLFLFVCQVDIDGQMTGHNKNICVHLTVADKDIKLKRLEELLNCGL